jgi:septal ring factor EnvC (AmiA/AmiB activator)
MILVEVDRDVIRRLKAELAEARAQIMAKDAELNIWILGHAKLQSEHQAQIAAKDAEIARLWGMLTRFREKIRQLRAQIAAKDAALRIARSYVSDSGAVIDTIDAALAAPAREE